MGMRFVPIKVRYALVSCVLAAAHVPIAQGGGASIILQPVPPKTIPPSDYPPGTTIVGQEIIFGSVPARVWLDIHVTGWGPEVVKTIQARIAATDDDQDGGGYLGSNADCLGSPAIGAGDLWPARQSCSGPGAAGNLDCRANLSGLPAPCPVGEPSRCVVWNGISLPYFPPGTFCEPSFQNKCDPRWIGTGTMNTAAVDPHLSNRFGIHFEAGLPQDFQPSYLGTIVLDIPPNAKGTYTIDFDETQTYMQDASSNNLPVSTFAAARVTVPCGRCCSGYQSGAIECVDRVSENQCADANDQVFSDEELCPDSGGPDCPQCAADANCEDGQYCNGPEVCELSGMCGPGAAPCQTYEECEESTDSCSPRIPAVSTWGLLILGLLFMIVAKQRSLAP